MSSVTPTGIAILVLFTGFFVLVIFYLIWKEVTQKRRLNDLMNNRPRKKRRRKQA